MTHPVARALPTPERLGEPWRFDGYGPLSSQQPLTAAGDRLLGVAGSTIFAIDIYRGKEPPLTASSPERGFPYSMKSPYGEDPYLVAAAGVVYFMDGDELTALRLNDGLPLQKRDKEGKLVPWKPPVLWQVSGLIAANDKIIAVHIGESGNTEVSAFVAVNGEPAFGPIPISTLSPGRVSYGEGAVFFVAEGKLHAVNVDFGDRRFASTGGGATSEPLHQDLAPCVARDVVAAAGSRLHFFDVKTGAECFTAVAPTNARDAWQSPILADKGNVFIASNTSEVMAVRTSDGSVLWRTPIANPSAPTLIPGHVLVTSDRRMLASLSLATGEVDRLMELPQIADGMSPVVTNETVFIPDAAGSVEGRPFARQHAAHFDGVRSCIDVEPDGHQFDFGTEDFTIEAWIRSSEGGEIVSSHTTEPGSREHGFRLNLGENGELRVAIVDESAKRMHAGRTRETHANDGEWHHVALIRRDHSLLALLDGKSLEIHFRDNSEAGLSIGGRSALTIGASRAAAGKPAEHHFAGLIRELRIWDRALDVATVQNNRHVKLTGNEPRLKGLWTLAELQKPGMRKDPVNAVARHGAHATFNNAASVPADLTLDNSGFPYLLHEVQSHWPYAGTWAARGEQPVNTRAAITNTAIAFGTNNALYGVRRADGRRLWQVDMPGEASAPVADGGRFFVLTSDDGLIGVNSATGEYARVDAFAGFMKATTAPLAAPVMTPTHMAAGSPFGSVRIVDRVKDPVAIRDVAVSGAVRELAMGDHYLFALCDAPSGRQMVGIDLATGVKTLAAVSGDAFAADRDWVFCVREGKLSRLAGGALGNPAQASTTVAGTITGLAARRDRDLLVVGTAAGEVHGYAMTDLSRRWSVTLPVGRARDTHAVYAPVFDHSGRICCATSSGTVAVLDPATGARVGLYISTQGAVTPAMFSAATAYYGCADAESADAYRDGALHSVVFGETMVLRLGLNERGEPSRSEPHGVVDIQAVDASKHTLHLMDPSRSCIEAWVNIPSNRVNSKRRPGGGVLGICPTDAGGFDVNLEIDETGRLLYRTRALLRGKWRMLRVEADTPLGDGDWHHVAVSRDGEQSVTVYVDGVAVPRPVISYGEDAPGNTVAGLKAYIGAVAGEDLAALKPFCGMIADVRVWDTFLEPAEISARMHVKLRGSEPDLLAFWNFDRQNVEDAGPDHHHGTIVGAGDQPIWWLSDLAFEKPSYPYITTTATVFRNTPGEPKTYEVTCTVRRADGTGMPSQPIDLWYVRNRDDHPKDLVIGMDAITGVRSAEEPEPGVPSPDGLQRVLSLTAGADGSVKFLVTPTRIDFTPAIDLRAGFMPRNERFHVNVLLDEQMLVPPTPPSLVVQSKLIQDYAYSSGGTIDENRDRSTWRTVIRAANPDGTLRVGEPISLWSELQTSVQVGGRSYAINKENSAELLTDSQGEVVIVSDANALTAPTLMARAGFMHRSDRVVIAPDQELHRTLSDVRGSDLTQKRATRWNPKMKDGEGEALLAGDYAPHAGKVANAITTVMASARPADAETAAPPRGQAHLLRSKARSKARRKLRGAERLLYDTEPMHQPERLPGRDRVVTFRTMAHTPQVQSLNPGGTRDALDDNAGFVLEAVTSPRGKQAIRFQMLETREEVDEERGIPTAPKVMLRGIFGDIWDGIKDVATDIYEGAVKIVVSIADAVEVAIHKLVDGVMNVVHVVVRSVVEAVNAVAGFFEQLGVLIMKAIEFLRALFNWKAIIATKNIISDLFVQSIDTAKRTLSPANIEAALLPLTKAGDVRPAKGGPSVNGEAAAAGEPSSPVLDESRSVQGQMVMQKSRDTGISTSASGDKAPKPAEAANPFEDFFRAIPSVIPGLLDLSLSDMVDKLLAIVQRGMDASIRMMISALKEVSATLVKGIEWVMEILGTEIRIPFLSELYKWITGRALTLLDLVCLALAVPVHIAHIAITTAMGRTRTFADDNSGLVARLKAAEQGSRAPRAVLKASDRPMLGDAKVPARMDTSSETLLIVLRSINLASGLVSDGLFTKSVSSGGISAASQGEARVRGLVKVIKGATGIAASYVQTWESTPKFEQRMQSGLEAAVWESVKPEPWIPLAIFAVLVLGDSFTFFGGAKQFVLPPLPKPLSAAGYIDGGSDDEKEHAIAIGAAFGCIGLIVKRTMIQKDTLDKLLAAKADPNLVNMVKMYYIRDISMIVARMPWAMYTQTGANRLRRWFGGGASLFYGLVTGVRFVAGGAALATHVIAAYDYGQKP